VAVVLIVGAGEERGDDGLADGTRVVEMRPLGEPGPATGDLAVAEPVVRDALAAQHVQRDLDPVAAQLRDQLLGGPDHVGVVRAAQPAVTRHQDHAGAANLRTRYQQWMVDVGVGRERREHVRDRLRVRPRRLHPLTRLADPAGGDELLRLGDLLRAADGAELAPQQLYLTGHG
jgi:hypothetical protein